jgi:hypothetical protein
LGARYGRPNLQSQLLGRQKQEDEFEDNPGKINETLFQKQNRNKRAGGHSSNVRPWV